MECDRNICYTALQNDLSRTECEAMRSGEYYDDYDMTDSYNSGCEYGFNRAVERFLELMDKVSHKASAKGQFWTAEKTIKVLRRDVEALKGGEHK